MRVSVFSARYSSVCNVSRLWNISLIPTYRVYRLYDIYIFEIHTEELDAVRDQLVLHAGHSPYPAPLTTVAREGNKAPSGLNHLSR